MAQQYTQVLTQGGFAAKDTFARMAARRVAEREADRQRQIKLQDDVMKNIAAAEDDMKQDPSGIGADLAKVGEKLNEAHREDFTAAAQAYESNPTNANLHAMNAVTRRLEDNMNKIKTVSGYIKQMEEKGLDPILDAGISAGYFDFKKSIGSAAEDYDPRTGTIKGQSVIDYFLEKVPISDAKGFVDSDKAMEDWRKGVIEKGREDVQIIDGVKYTYEQNSYDRTKAFSLFKDMSPDVIAKEKQKKIAAYSQDMESGNEDSEYGAYMSTDDNGRVYMTTAQLFQYEEDNNLKSRERRLVGKEDIPEKAPTQTEQETQKTVEHGVEVIGGFIRGGMGQAQKLTRDESITISGEFVRANKPQIARTKDGFKVFFSGKNSEGDLVSELANVRDEGTIDRLVALYAGRTEKAHVRQSVVKAVLAGDYATVKRPEHYGWILDQHGYESKNFDEDMGLDDVDALVKEINGMGIKANRVNPHRLGSNKRVIKIGDKKIDLNKTKENFDAVRDELSMAIYNADILNIEDIEDIDVGGVTVGEFIEGLPEKAKKDFVTEVRNSINQ